jgi:glycosyltransferase involved in cell wall biosynthesis
LENMLQVVYMGAVDWNFIRQRPQQLALELSRYYKVLYVWRTSPASYFWLRQPLPPRCVTINDNLRVLWPRILPFHKYGPVRVINLHLIRRAIRPYLGSESADVLWLSASSPWDYGYHRLVRASLICYDCMDNLPLLRPDLGLDTLEERFFQAADLVFVSSHGLYERATNFASQVILVQNGVDFAHFVQGATQLLPPPPDLETLPRPRIGFYGTIGDWIDFELAEHAACAHPDWSFLFIGPREVPFSVTNGLEHLPNVRFLGARSYDDLPAYLQHVDVWWLPFRRNLVTDNVDPVKVYEYLAAAKPVVATKLAETEKFAPLIELAIDNDEFVTKMEKALVREDHERDISARLHFAAQNTWEERGRSIKEAIETALKGGGRA